MSDETLHVSDGKVVSFETWDALSNFIAEGESILTINTTTKDGLGVDYCIQCSNQSEFRAMITHNRKEILSDFSNFDKMTAFISQLVGITRGDVSRIFAKPKQKTV